MIFLDNHYHRSRGGYVTDFYFPKFKDKSCLLELAGSYRFLNIRGTSLKSLTNLSSIWLGATELVHLSSDNLLACKGLILDSETLDVLMIALIDEKYRNVYKSNLGILDRCIEIYTTHDFVRSKAFNKLHPVIKDLKLNVLPNKELKKLYV